MEKVISEIKNRINSDKCVVACSTGVDSSVLLDIVLCALDKKQVVIAHVNHKKRLESEQEEEYISDFAKKQGIEIEIMHLETKITSSFQEQARIIRKNFFTEVANKHNAKFILTAHTINDDVETSLMKIFKKSSIESYYGMNKIYKIGNINVFKPLLCVSKAEIYDYATKNGIKYFEDYSNNELDYTRNKYRNEIINKIEEINPKYLEAFASFKENLVNLNAILVEKLDNIINDIVTFNSESINIDLLEFKKLDLFIKRELLFKLLRKYELSSDYIDEIIKKINSEKKVVDKISENLTLVKEYNNITFIIINVDIYMKPIYMTFDKEGIYINEDKKIEITKNQCIIEYKNLKMCYNIYKLPIIIRSIAAGDKIKVKVGHKKVNDILTNKKIKYLQRLKTLVLCDDTEVLHIIKGKE